MDLFKIIVIIFMIFVFYKLYQNDILTENFQSSNSNLVDDWNAINQLAQLSKKLMAGGLTIPGSLKVAGNLTLASGDATNTWNINCTSDYLRFNNGKDDIFTLGRSGNDAYLSNLWTKAIRGDTSFFGKGDSQVQIGQGYSPNGACVYASSNELQIGSAKNKVVVQGDLNTTGNITTGNITANSIKVGNTTINSDGTITNSNWVLENNGDIRFKNTGTGIRLISANGATYRLIGSCGPSCTGIYDGVGLYSYRPDGGYRGNPANWVG